MGNEIDKAVKNAGDTLNEGVHRLESETEKGRRSVAGDAMSPGEKARSVGNEVVADGKAEADKLKREVRNMT